MDTGAGNTTEYFISEVKGVATTIHLDFYDKDSHWVHNTTIPITAWGTKLQNIAALIKLMNATERAALLVDFAGGTDNYYMGYFYADNSNASSDNLLVDWYIFDLANGIASGANLPVKEFYNNTDYDLRICDAGGVKPAGWTYEQWSANALSAAQDLVWGNNPLDTDSTFNPVWFAFYGRYMINSLTTGGTYFILWSSDDGTQFHIYVINKEEKYRSTTIDTDEVTIVDSIKYIAQYLIDTDEIPYAGIFNFTYPGANRGGGLPAIPAAVDANQEWLGWNWQYDSAGTAIANWQGMTMMARDVGTIGIDPSTGLPDADQNVGTAAPQPFYVQ